MSKTVQEICNTLTESQKLKVYKLIAEAINPRYRMSKTEIDLDFLSNEDQKIAVKALIDTAIYHYNH